MTTCIRALNQLGFKKQREAIVLNAFRHELKHLRWDHEPHSSFKSARIPIYNEK
ncbi:uncharacterized protein G2W53_004317 [Senna tora]|uniref:Uncharacterized protein n=1 Tax=Senna tora TaxID=362788 RepID=A0A834XBM5_9FABA|nr:uncharacterized protein G2W53_004317 [Senna tora]